MEENVIEILPIKDILTWDFFIPDYQRGYRWTELEVEKLLDDIWEFKDKPNKKEGEFYCLQPVVGTLRFNEKKKINQWELIDGQQRLTSIYILLSYIHNNIFKNADDIFTLEFATRPGSEDFLKMIDTNRKDENIDFYYICLAFEAIKSWFKGKGNQQLIATQIYPILLENTKIIWYEVNDGSPPVEIFTRLNMGKIPLTNSELIKALLLSKDNFNDDDSIQLKQYEIAGGWDRIEYALQNNEFWFFLNNKDMYPASRIEFIFDLMAGRQTNHDEFYTFRYFHDKIMAKNNMPIEKKIYIEWEKVNRFYLTFEEWFHNREIYHLTGYLIAVGKKIEDIKILSVEKLKSEFIDDLNGLIKKTVDYNISQLNFETSADKAGLMKVLLLFNVVTEINNIKSTDRFPFNRYKGNGNEKLKWILEHIHAQNSDSLTNKDQWVSWLEAHKSSLKRIDPEKHAYLIKEINENISEISEDKFKSLSKKILIEFKDTDQEDKMHGIHNLALLDKDSNSALNSSIFEVKRNILIDRELKGSFIPICTRNVFMKYYSRPAKDLFFWSKNDKENYFSAIIETLSKDYLPENNSSIQVQKES